MQQAKHIRPKFLRGEQDNVFMRFASSFQNSANKGSAEYSLNRGDVQHSSKQQTVAHNVMPQKQARPAPTQMPNQHTQTQQHPQQQTQIPSGAQCLEQTMPQKQLQTAQTFPNKLKNLIPKQISLQFGSDQKQEELQIQEDGWEGRTRTHEWLDQNQLPYHLATSQQDQAPQQTLSLVERKISIKHTILIVFATIMLSFFLFSRPAKAKNIENPETFAQNPSQNFYQQYYLAKTHNSPQQKSPIKQVRFFNDGIIYENNGSLFFNQERLSLISTGTEDQNLKIHHIDADSRDFYLATSIGVFKNFRRIYSGGECEHLVRTRSKIYIACAQGVFQSKIPKKTIEKFYWELMPKSPRQAKFIVLNPKSKKKLPKYVSSGQGFYFFNAKKSEWQNRSYGLKRDFLDTYGFGRFLVQNVDSEDKDSTEQILLPTSYGIYVTYNGGKTWVKNSQGLKPNPNGFHQIRLVRALDKQLLALSSSGLYLSDQDKKLKWQRISITQSLKDINKQENFYALGQSSDKLLIGNSQGQIFEFKKKAQFAKKIAKAEKNRDKAFVHSEEDLKNIYYKIIKQEPSVQETQKAALKYSGIPDGLKFDKYRRQARFRNILPDFETFVDTNSQDITIVENEGGDSFTSSTGSLTTTADATNTDKDDDTFNAGAKLSWDLGNLIYDNEVNDINTSARITANVRDNLLTEVTQIYFMRKELLVQILKEVLFTNAGMLDHDYVLQKLKFEEYTAQLDARTGAWFTKQLKANLELDDLSPQLKVKLKEIYFDS